MRFIACFLLILFSFNSSAVVDLDKTVLGRAVKKRDVLAFQQKLDKLAHRHAEYSLKILKAKDLEGNTLFHRMAQVQGPKQEAFAGQILYLGYFLMSLKGIKGLEFASSPDKRGLSPIEVAEKAGNSFAVRNLMAMRNLEIHFAGRQKELFQELLEPEAEQRQKEFLKKNLLGGILIVNGLIFSFFGLDTGLFVPLMLGAPQLAIGGMTCYEAFKSSKELINKNENIRD